MAIVDVQHWDRNKRHSQMMRPIAAFADEDEDGMVDYFDIEMMENLIGRPLTDGQFNYYRRRNRPS